MRYQAKICVMGLGLLALTWGGRAAADSVDASAQGASEQAKIAAVDSIATQIAMFRNAAEQWVSANVVNDAWNQNQSLAPHPFGTYAPILLYSGSNNALCGAPAGTAQSINLVAAGYITANYTAPYSGEYCAMIYPDSGTGNVPGPVGPNGGSDTVPVTTVLAYFVAGTNTDPEEILHGATSDFTVSHVGGLLAGNFAAGGSVKKFTPVITNSGTGNSAWQIVNPQ